MIQNVSPQSIVMEAPVWTVVMKIPIVFPLSIAAAVMYVFLGAMRIQIVFLQHVPPVICPPTPVMTQTAVTTLIVRLQSIVTVAPAWQDAMKIPIVP